MSKMEFLDINLTKDSSLSLHTIHSPFYWWVLKKTILYSGFKTTYEKAAKQENSILFMTSILWNQTKTQVWEDLSLCPETLTKNAIQEFHL